MIHFNSKIAKLLLTRGYVAFMLFGNIFIKTKKEETEKEVITHEEIHVEQWKEVMFVTFAILNIPSIGNVDIGYISMTALISFLAFYVWYAVEYLIRFAKTCNHREAYKGICFEREAYENQKNNNYPSDRCWFSFLKYMP